MNLVNYKTLCVHFLPLWFYSPLILHVRDRCLYLGIAVILSTVWDEVEHLIDFFTKKLPPNEEEYRTWGLSNNSSSHRLFLCLYVCRRFLLETNCPVVSPLSQTHKWSLGSIGLSRFNISVCYHPGLINKWRNPI